MGRNFYIRLDRARKILAAPSLRGLSRKIIVDKNNKRRNYWVRSFQQATQKVRKVKFISAVESGKPIPESLTDPVKREGLKKTKIGRSLIRTVIQGKKMATHFTSDFDGMQRDWIKVLSLSQEIQSGNLTPEELEAKTNEANSLARNVVRKVDYDGLMNALRQNTGYSTKDAEEAFSNTVMLDIGQSGRDGATVSQAAYEFTKIAGDNFLQNGKAPIRKILYNDPRAGVYMDTMVLNVGQDEGGDTYDQMFHELGHTLEAQGDTYEISKAWLKARSISEEPVQHERMPEGELCYEGDYFHPYVAKKYEHESTEVASMGCQMLVNMVNTINFASLDPEHFYLTLGLLSRKQNHV